MIVGLSLFITPPPGLPVRSLGTGTSGRLLVSIPTDPLEYSAVALAPAAGGWWLEISGFFHFGWFVDVCWMMLDVSWFADCCLLVFVAASRLLCFVSDWFLRPFLVVSASEPLEGLPASHSRNHTVEMCPTKHCSERIPSKIHGCSLKRSIMYNISTERNKNWSCDPHQPFSADLCSCYKPSLLAFAMRPSLRISWCLVWKDGQRSALGLQTRQSVFCFSFARYEGYLYRSHESDLLRYR